ncbi:MAG: heat-inducible transcriptional repressor HrcA [Candidatus Omnitrophota bacterium]
MVFNKTKRENDVLHLIVANFVDTANPVGSRLISKQLGLSSATIRNVMQDLEEAGYIAQPYASAGRVPTEKGYRYYVDSLLHMKKLTEKQIQLIDSEYRTRVKSLEELLERTSHVLSLITNCAGIAIFPKIKERSFRHISLVPLSGAQILVLLVTASGYVKNFIIHTAVRMGKGELERISNFLNSEFYNMTLSEIKEYLVKKIKSERDASYRTAKEAYDVIDSVMAGGFESDLYLDGASHILSQPELKDRRKMSAILKFLENKTNVTGLFSDESGERGLRIQIGRENKVQELRDCSVISKEYTFREMSCGRVGIIGLTRMDYERVIPIVDFLSVRVSMILSEWE